VNPNLVVLDAAFDDGRTDTYSSVDRESVMAEECGFELTNTILDPDIEDEHYYNIYTPMLPYDLGKMGMYLVVEAVEVVQNE